MKNWQLPSLIAYGIISSPSPSPPPPPPPGCNTLSVNFMAALNPEAPPFFYYGRVPSPDRPLYTPSTTRPFFDPPRSTPCHPPMPQSLYNYPNCSFLCSNLPYHPPTQNPFYIIHGNLHPTQQPFHPSLSFPQPRTEPQAREEDGAAHSQPIATTVPNNKRYKAPRFYKNRREDMQFQAVQGKVWVPKGTGKTTFMIKNIPYKYTEEIMLQFLDDHCRAENVKLIREEQENKDSMSAYDFFYLPIDFRTRGSRGYAFVNFTSESGATRLRRALDGYKWGAVGWNRTCQISYARIQRKEELEKHFKRSNFYCGTEAYLPVIFHPYRNGSCNFQATRLGNLLTITRDGSTQQGETNESTASNTKGETAESAWGEGWGWVHYCN